GVRQRPPMCDDPSNRAGAARKRRIVTSYPEGTLGLILQGLLLVPFTLLPITIAVSWMRGILPSATAMRVVPSSHDVVAALFHLSGAVKSARWMRETAARLYHSRSCITQLESRVHTGPSSTP